jgi:hypothetical protein
MLSALQKNKNINFGDAPSNYFTSLKVRKDPPKGVYTKKRVFNTELALAKESRDSIDRIQENIKVFSRGKNPFAKMDYVGPNQEGYAPIYEREYRPPVILAKDIEPLSRRSIVTTQKANTTKKGDQLVHPKGEDIKFEDRMFNKHINQIQVLGNRKSTVIESNPTDDTIYNKKSINNKSIFVKINGNKKSRVEKQTPINVNQQGSFFNQKNKHIEIQTMKNLSSNDKNSYDTTDKNKNIDQKINVNLSSVKTKTRDEVRNHVDVNTNLNDKYMLHIVTARKSKNWKTIQQLEKQTIDPTVNNNHQNLNIHSRNLIQKQNSLMDQNGAPIKTKEGVDISYQTNKNKRTYLPQNEDNKKIKLNQNNVQVGTNTSKTSVVENNNKEMHNSVELSETKLKTSTTTHKIAVSNNVGLVNQVDSENDSTIQKSLNDDYLKKEEYSPRPEGMNPTLSISKDDVTVGLKQSDTVSKNLNSFL